MIKSIIRPLQSFFLKQRSRKLIHCIKKLENFSSLNYLDIGAAGDIGNRWNAISNLLNYTGFEPHEGSRQELLNNGGNFNRYQILNNAIGKDNKENKFFVCSKSDTSSLLPPNLKFLQLFPDSGRYDVIREENMKTSSLDSLQLQSMDFIKLDIQGMELEALKGGENLLDKCLGVESEVQFVSLYDGACSFDDLSSFLKDKGFVFIDFIKIIRWSRDNISNNLGQCIWADALFLRSPEYICSLNDPDILEKYIVISLMYNRFDLIDFLISHSENNTKELTKFSTSLKSIRRKNKNLNNLKKGIELLYRTVDSNSKLHFLN